MLLELMLLYDFESFYTQNVELLWKLCKKWAFLTSLVIGNPHLGCQNRICTKILAFNCCECLHILYLFKEFNSRKMEIFIDLTFTIHLYCKSFPLYYLGTHTHTTEEKGNHHDICWTRHQHIKRKLYIQITNVWQYHFISHTHTCTHFYDTA